MHILTLQASISPDNLIKVVLFLGFASLVIAGPLLYRILFHKENFGWFRGQNIKRPDKKQWDSLRDKADKIIDGREMISAEQLYELLTTMHLEIEVYNRGRKTIEYERDRERINKLSEKLEGMDTKIEPFDSLIECLKKDSLIKHAQKLNNMIHNPTGKSFAQLKKELLTEFAQIKKESWNTTRHDTKTKLKECIKCLKQNPFKSVYIYIALFAFGLGLKLYHSIVEDKGYKFYKENPVWIIVFAIIIGLPLIILSVKYMAWKYSPRENPYQSNPTSH